jgi:hypothetical protein
MNDVLGTILPFVSGIVVASVGYFAVHQQNKTQRATLKETTASQAEQQRRERLTAWRRERYGELLAAFAEYRGTVRSMSRVWDFTGPDQASQERMKVTLEHFMEVDLSSRVAELAERLADGYYKASRQLIVAITAQLPRDEKALGEAHNASRKQFDELNERRYELNQLIEKLISAGD